jgi:hypothetical protein
MPPDQRIATKDPIERNLVLAERAAAVFVEMVVGQSFATVVKPRR